MLRDPEVFDVHGAQRDMEWLRAKYPGVTLIQAPIGPGERVFRLVRIRETVGPAVLVVRVFNAEGRPNQNDVALWWSTGEVFVAPTVKTLYENPVGAVQKTDVSGHTGFGLSAGSVIKDGKGPHKVWVVSPTLPSDGLLDFGWLGGTEHMGPLSLDFQIQSAPVLPPPEPPPPAPGRLYGVRIRIGDQTEIIGTVELWPLEESDV